MQTTEKIRLLVTKDQESSYFEMPFTVPADVCRIDIRYFYLRHREIVKGRAVEVQEENIIDFALKDANGEFVGASGSNRTHLWISEYDSSLGFALKRITQGKWAVIVGAYKVMDTGVTVDYEFTFTHKERTLLKGDLHIHSLGSDGKLTVEEIISIAKKTGLQFIFLTDHNNYFQNDRLRSDAKLTVMPGVEWTHYQGHVNLLGLEQAFDRVCFTNTLEETREILELAREKGAIVSINHPFCPQCGFKWGLDNVEYECVEIWNGLMKQAELDCLAWWHGELCKGRKLPVVGGSDFHRHELGRGIGIPTTCLYSMSRAPSDLYTAIREGCGFISYTPVGPEVYMECDGKVLGQTVKYQPGLEMKIEVRRLRQGDVIKIITDRRVETITCEVDLKKTTLIKPLEKVMFYRTEVHRDYVGNGVCLPVMLSNPVYVE